MIFFIGIVNYIIDPLWCFNKNIAFGENQDGFNERQQKTNKITFTPFDYDTLIIGSSRTTYINQNDFEGTHAFNYACSNMDPYEYNGYIEYAKKINKKPFKKIIIGVDFFRTNEKNPSQFENPIFYINKSNSFLYRLKNLISLDALRFSLGNVAKKYISSNYFGYSRITNVKYMNKIDEEYKKKLIKCEFKEYSKRYGKKYKYRNIKKIFNTLKNNNRDTEFIVFTTPVSKVLLELINQQGRLIDYKKWIRDCVQSFGKLYNFMYLNDITKNLDNYKDLDHFKPEVGSLIAQRITGYTTPKARDFGVLVTKNNMEQHLKFIDNNFRALNDIFKKKDTPPHSTH